MLSLILFIILISSCLILVLYFFLIFSAEIGVRLICRQIRDLFMSDTVSEAKLWIYSTNSHTSEAISHLLKAMLTYAFGRHGQLSTGYWSYEDLISLLNKTGSIGTTVWMHRVNSNETHGKEQDRNYSRMVLAVSNKSWKLQTVRPLTTHLTSHPSQTNKTFWYCTWRKDEVISGLLHIDAARLTDQEGLTYISSVRTLDAV